MREWNILNLNATARVKLTPLGEKIWCYYWTPYASGRDPMDILDSKTVDGYLEEQLWEIMRMFGSHLHNGSGMPFATDILVCIEKE